MAVLKIKDANGNWQNIVALKGDQGERGPEGPVGPAGGVNSVNGMTGDVTIASYSLPTASSNTLGGVKVGSNITNSSGTISLTKANVTNALCYTPLQTAPVSSVNGQTGAVTGLATLANPTFTGTPKAPTATAGTNTTQVATTAFVTTAVANKTSVSGNAGTATKLATPRTITLTGDATGSVSFDGSSDVSMAVTVSGGGGGGGDAIPKTGDRGSLAGYETIAKITAASGDVVTINEESPDTLYITQKDKNSNFTIKIERTLGSETASTKLVLLFCNWPTLVTVQLGTDVYVDNYMTNGFVNELAVEGIERWIIPFSDWTFVSKLKYV